MFFIIQRNLSSEKKPRLVGIINNYGTGFIGPHDIFHAKSDVIISTVGDIQYGMALVDELFSYIGKNLLWENMAYMLMISSTRFIEYQYENVGISNYELICNFLTSLNNESFEIRATTTALEYIQDRTSLSQWNNENIIFT
jgi:hypothetical protein